MGRDRKSTHRNNHKQAWKQGLRELEIIVELTSLLTLGLEVFGKLAPKGASCKEERS
jgi:hypothetical protein